MIGMEGKMLRSERLAYRLLNPSDKVALGEMLSDRIVTEPAGFLPPEDIDSFFETLTAYNTALGVLRDGELIGYIRVNKYVSDHSHHRDKTCVSTGFVINKKYHGKGYGTETLQTVTEYLKNRFDLCFADHFEGNEPSKRVIEKCGYKYFEKYTMYFDELGREITCLSYVI